jgi:membrane protease YdiL (CAAX protease family)
MENIAAPIKKNPVLAYFILTFTISWGGLFFGGGGVAGFPKSAEQFQAMMSFFIPVVLLGPSLSCLILTWLISGRAGFRELLSRLLKWRVAIKWYVIALFSGPLILLVSLFLFSWISHKSFSGMIASINKAPNITMGIVAGLIVGFFEELGWTGFATPRLRGRHSILMTGLILGVIWGAWHVFLNVIFVKDVFTGGLNPALYLTSGIIGDLVGLLTAFRILMVWVYDRTKSLPVAMLMHAGLTAMTISSGPIGITGGSLLISNVITIVLAWAIVAAVVLANRRQFTQ